MKKILSMLVMCALLLAALGVASSAAAYYEQGTPAVNTRVTVRKSNPTIDGVITPGEYDEYTGGYTEWYVAENASDYFDNATAMAAGAKWYFAWDGEYFYLAATWDAGPGANQTYPGGYIYSDKALSGTDEYVHCDDCLGFGPGINVVSAEASTAEPAWTRFYYVVSENTATGERIHGTYSYQNGQNQDYVADTNDFDFTYAGTIVTAEYKIPVRELTEKFVEGSATSMFNASILLQAGVATVETTTGDNAVYPNSLSWGVRLGQYSYNSDSGNTEKGHATFRLVDEYIEQPDSEETTTPPTDTTAPGETTTPGTTAPGTTEGGSDEPANTTAPVGTTEGGSGDEPTGTAADGTTAPTGTATSGGTVTPGTGNEGGSANNNGGAGTGTVVNRPTQGNNTTATQTADFGVVAAIVSAISACGVMISKKRR